MCACALWHCLGLLCSRQEDAAEEAVVLRLWRILFLRAEMFLHRSARMLRPRQHPRRQARMFPHQQLRLCPARTLTLSLNQQARTFRRRQRAETSRYLYLFLCRQAETFLLLLPRAATTRFSRHLLLHRQAMMSRPHQPAETKRARPTPPQSRCRMPFSSTASPRAIGTSP